MEQQREIQRLRGVIRQMEHEASLTSFERALLAMFEHKGKVTLSEIENAAIRLHSVWDITFCLNEIEEIAEKVYDKREIELTIKPR